MTTDIEIRKPTATALIPDAQNMRLLATDLFNSRMFRGIENVPQAVAVIQYGTEIGIGPMQALTNIKPIKGQMTMSARLIMGLAAAAGVSWKVVESTNKRCEIVFSRQGWEPVTSIFTIEEAEKAGLVRDDSGWAKYPQDMLFARAGTRGVRRIAPDTGFGRTYSTEEMQDAVIDVEPVPTNIPGAEPQSDNADEPVGHREALFPGDDDGESIADMAARSETEATGKTPEVEAAVKAIKDKLEVEGIDANSFKEWLFRFQNKQRPVRAYCGKIGKVIRFHLGKEKDILQLAQVEVMDKAISAFRNGK
jgi:hypothetical protein